MTTTETTPEPTFGPVPHDVQALAAGVLKDLLRLHLEAVDVARRAQAVEWYLLGAVPPSTAWDIAEHDAELGRWIRESGVELAFEVLSAASGALSDPVGTYCEPLDEKEVRDLYGAVGGFLRDLDGD